MLSDFIISQIKSNLPFKPTEEQDMLINSLGSFIVSRAKNRVFLLRGYAGTGKTSVMAAVVKTLNELKQKTLLLAPTGRAAKVLAAYAGFPAYTIHKCIYRQKSLAEQEFDLSYNTQQDVFFIVDEASMIANTKTSDTPFGTGRLLDDLIRFVFAGHNCSLILIGDDAQLPPIGQTISPALDKAYLEGFGLNVTSFQLTTVVRQALHSGILYNATWLRRQIADGNVNHIPHFEYDNFTDFQKLSGEEMLEELERSYREVGVEDTMVINRTNRRVNLYNKGIRGRVLWKEDELTGGDRLMITKNNYFWTKQYEGIDFLANGDIMEVVRLRNLHEMYGLHFADASLRAVDYDWEIDARLLLDTLFTDTPEQNYQLQQQLFLKIAEDYPEIRSRQELVKKIYESQYFNALNVKHAYAVTCHKAQGGQWKRVFIDQGKITDEQLGIDYYRWLYTAITRATEKCYLINFQ